MEGIKQKWPRMITLDNCLKIVKEMITEEDFSG